VKDLVEYIVRSLVSCPDAVMVEEIDGPKGTVVELQVDPSDMGMVIGRKGRTASAIRILMAAATPRGETPVSLEILD